jgi:hypothetical protein
MAMSGESFATPIKNALVYLIQNGAKSLLLVVGSKLLPTVVY